MPSGLIAAGVKASSSLQSFTAKRNMMALIGFHDYADYLAVYPGFLKHRFYNIQNLSFSRRSSLPCKGRASFDCVMRITIPMHFLDETYLTLSVKSDGLFVSVLD